LILVLPPTHPPAVLLGVAPFPFLQEAFGAQRLSRYRVDRRGGDRRCHQMRGWRNIKGESGNIEGGAFWTEAQHPVDEAQGAAVTLEWLRTDDGGGGGE
jgi:hypothetical protein